MHCEWSPSQLSQNLPCHWLQLWYYFSYWVVIMPLIF